MREKKEIVMLAPANCQQNNISIPDHMHEKVSMLMLYELIIYIARIETFGKRFIKFLVVKRLYKTIYVEIMLGQMGEL